MRHLPRLIAVVASFWVAGSASAVAAQEGDANPTQETSPNEMLSIDAEPSLTVLTITQSSRTDVPDTITVETAQVPKEATLVLDRRGAERLMRNEGITLQWIDWDTRGPAWVGATEAGIWTLLAGQKGEAGGRLDLEGFITEIGEDYFIFDGTIKMIGTPDTDRLCNVTKRWRFEVTQNRSYYRLREFEWCDYLTDYIDIYFPPSLR